MNTFIPETIKKQTDEAFGKKVYLLGIEEDGTKVWLEAPKWDCGWYWGFGYIERYRNNREPHLARDIDSHTHWQSLVGKIEGVSDYVHNVNDNPTFKATTLTEKESWKLSEYMKSYYTLKEMAEWCIYGAHISPDDDFVQRPELAKEINEKMLPDLFRKIDVLLSADVANMQEI